MTDCNEQKWLFQELGYRKVEVDFGGATSPVTVGGLILRELERHSGLLGDVAGCFIDYRDQRYVEHSVRELVSQRIHGLALGYEISTIMITCGAIGSWINLRQERSTRTGSILERDKRQSFSRSFDAQSPGVECTGY